MPKKHTKNTCTQKCQFYWSTLFVVDDAVTRGLAVFGLSTSRIAVFDVCNCNYTCMLALPMWNRPWSYQIMSSISKQKANRCRMLWHPAMILGIWCVCNKYCIAYWQNLWIIWLLPIVITLRAKLSGAVYCYRSCLFVCMWVCLFVCGLLLR